MNEFSLKELYSVVIKTTYPVEIDGRSFETGEVIAAFDKIKLANFQEIKSIISARGGYQNATRVTWDDTKELRLDFSQGIFSKTQYALMTNARLIKAESDNQVLLSEREELETDMEGNFSLTYSPVGKIFVYDKYGQKIATFDSVQESYHLEESYKDIVVDYNYNYVNSNSTMVVGQRLIQGFLTLEGRTRVKDDITGRTHTGILKIPKLKIVSGLSMQLGENASPVVGNISAIAYPSGNNRTDQKVMELVFLNDDIDSDM